MYRGAERENAPNTAGALPTTTEYQMSNSGGFDDSFEDMTAGEALDPDGTLYADTLTVAATFSSLETIADFVQQKAARSNLSFKRTWELMLAIDEICSNIIAHTLPTDEDRKISLTWTLEDGVVLMTLSDNGIAFNPLSVPPAEREEIEETRFLGGMGSYLIEKMVDSISYERKNHANLLTIRKMLKKERNGRITSRQNGKPDCRSNRSSRQGGIE